MAGSAISPSLLRQVDKAVMDDSRVFARGSPFSIGMDDWSEDPPEAESDSGKRKRLKLSLSRPPRLCFRNCDREGIGQGFERSCA